MLAPLLIATQNQGKLKEFRRLLDRHFTCSALSESFEVIENGKDYRENALIKANAFFEKFQIPVLADDSGLEVDALGGSPGLLSARFGGEALTWPERWSFLHAKLSGYPEETWTASFKCALCYFDGREAASFFEGSTAGKIVSNPRGDRGFGYDPIFYSPELQKTFGEAHPDEKERVSHRAHAIKKFLQWWTTQNPA